MSDGLEAKRHLAVERLTAYLREWAEGMEGFEYKIAEWAIDQAVEKVNEWQIDQIAADYYDGGTP